MAKLYKFACVCAYQFPDKLKHATPYISVIYTGIRDMQIRFNPLYP